MSLQLSGCNRTQDTQQVKGLPEAITSVISGEDIYGGFLADVRENPITNTTNGDAKNG